ncbi:hypothetical protein D3C81_808780 [compost metagenome]
MKFKLKVMEPSGCQNFCTSQADDIRGMFLPGESCPACDSIWQEAHKENIVWDYKKLCEEAAQDALQEAQETMESRRKLIEQLQTQLADMRAEAAKWEKNARTEYRIHNEVQDELSRVKKQLAAEVALNTKLVNTMNAETTRLEKALTSVQEITWCKKFEEGPEQVIYNIVSNALEPGGE